MKTLIHSSNQQVAGAMADGPCCRRAFTLVELLVVVAIIGLLAALLFPSLGAAKNASLRAKIRAQFSQWTLAIEAYRVTYGHYPAFHESHLVNPSAQDRDPGSVHLFHDILAARRRDGSTLPVAVVTTIPLAPELQNRRLVRFHVFTAEELPGADAPNSFLLVAASGLADIAVLVDANLDGVIDSADYGSTLPAVGGLTPSSADIPAAGVRAGVIFYAPGPGATPTAPAFVFSWK